MVQAITGSGTCTNWNSYTYTAYSPADLGEIGSSSYTITKGTTLQMSVPEDGKATANTNFTSNNTSNFTTTKNADGSLKVVTDNAANKSTTLTVTFNDSGKVLTYTIKD